MEYRINGFEQIKSFYGLVFNNEHPFKPHHISLYLFLINQNNRSNWMEWFKCPYDLAMNGACINSRETYYRCLHELQDWNLIEYHPGLNNWKAPLVKLIVLSKNGQLNGHVDVPVPEQVVVQPPGQLPEQVVRQAVEQLVGQLPEHIYKHITNNIKLITDNIDTVLEFIKNSKPKKSCLFKNSEYANFDLFEKQFEGTEYANADIKYYYDSFMDWSNSKGKLAKDWIATVRGGMRRDKTENKLKLKKPIITQLAR